MKLIRAALIILSLIIYSDVYAIVLDNSCTISILNRTIQVQENGTWVMPNIPANLGQIRARATCINNGETIVGQSDYFTVIPDRKIEVGKIYFQEEREIAPIPDILNFFPAWEERIDGNGSTLELTLLAAYRNGLIENVTKLSTGTNYSSTNPAVATVNQNGVVTAISTGSVIITARKDGMVAIKQITVVTSGDTDSDGIPDDYETANGLDPNDPIDAFEDHDDDGLTALEEFNAGTDINNPDSDSDGISDHEELVTGTDGYITNALEADTDSDGLNDELEILVGSDPTNQNDTNLAAAISKITITPENPTIVFNSIAAEASTQVIVTGQLIDSNVIDLTDTSSGSNYSTSNINIVSFGIQPGQLFAGQEGTATVTVTNSGHSATADVTVTRFDPVALSYIDLSGPPQNVDVEGDFAYVAAGNSGLHIVDVTNRSAPVLVKTITIPGYAKDIRAQGNKAYVAGGAAGMTIVDITEPSSANIISTVDTLDARDVFILGEYAYVADGSNGLTVVNITNPESAFAIGQLSGFTADGVAAEGTLAVLVGQNRLFTVNITDPTDPVMIGNINVGLVYDVELSDNFAHVAAYTLGYKIFDVSNPSSPQQAGSVNDFYPFDVALSGDGLAFFAEQLFVSAVPYVNISSPTNPIYQGFVDFSRYRDDDGNGLDVDSQYVYMTTNRNRLYIGQYRMLQDNGNVPPRVTLTKPVLGEQAYQGSRIKLKAEASDDIFVAAVRFEINGEVVFADTSPPYEYEFRIPVDATSLSVSATALDLASNLGFSESVLVDVIPDPGTTIIGRVIDGSGNSVEGAGVICLGLPVTTGPDGTFSIQNAPTVQGDIICNASHVNASGMIERGRSSALAPVSDGTTDVGTIQLTSYLLFDTFDTRDDNAWGLNTYQEVPYLFGEENVLKMVGRNGFVGFNSTVKLVDGQEVMFDFYLAQRGVQHFMLQAPGQRFAMVIFWRGRLTVQTQINSSGYSYPKTLIQNPQTGIWYTGLLRVNDEGQFYMKVWERDNPSVSNDYQVAMPAGLEWTFGIAKYFTFPDYLDNVRIYNTNSLFPDVTFGNSPTSGEFIQGDTVNLRADVNSEMPITSVQLLVNGASVSTDTSYPYEFTYDVPADVTTVDISFLVTDILGNEVTSSVSSIRIVPDAGTIVIGRVVDASLIAVSGADVSCLGTNETTLADGSFSVSLNSSLEDIICDVFYSSEGQIYTGRSATITPVRAGNTDIGNITISLLGTSEIFFDDFEGTVKQEWSNNTIGTNATIGKYSGRFGATDSLNFNFNGFVPPHDALWISYDLILFDSWDGNNTTYGPDHFTMTYDPTSSLGNYTQVFNETFRNLDSVPLTNQSYQETSPSIYSHFAYSASWRESVYRNLNNGFVLPHGTSDGILVKLQGQNLQTLDDESWGVDNFSVKLGNYASVTDFESGTLSEIADSSFNNGSVSLVQRGTSFSTHTDTTTINMGGDYFLRLSSGPGIDANSESLAIATTEPFVAGEFVLFNVLSERTNTNLVVEILDTENSIRSSYTITASTVIKQQKINTVSLAGRAIKLRFRQNTTEFGFNWFTLIDDIKTFQDITHSAATTIFTTATGVALDSNNQPVADAQITCAFETGITAADGSFSIPYVSTYNQTFSCQVSGTDALGNILSGSVNNNPIVRGGISNIGTFIVERTNPDDLG